MTSEISDDFDPNAEVKTLEQAQKLRKFFEDFLMSALTVQWGLHQELLKHTKDHLDSAATTTSTTTRGIDAIEAVLKLQAEMMYMSMKTSFISVSSEGLLKLLDKQLEALSKFFSDLDLLWMMKKMHATMDNLQAHYVRDFNLHLSSPGGVYPGLRKEGKSVIRLDCDLEQPEEVAEAS